MCIVPLNLREFHRKIRGKHLVVAPELEVWIYVLLMYACICYRSTALKLPLDCPNYHFWLLQEEERKYKERAKFGKKPRYGTVGETLYVKGMAGLVDEEV